MKMYDTILVPIDGSSRSYAGLEYALSTHSGAKITVLHVIDPIESSYTSPKSLMGNYREWYERSHETAGNIFSEAQDIADEYDIELSTKAVIGHPARVILDYADENNVDHIVIGSHGRKEEARIPLGSIAETVAQRASISVSIVR